MQHLHFVSGVDIDKTDIGSIVRPVVTSNVWSSKIDDWTVISERSIVSKRWWLQKWIGAENLSFELSIREVSYRFIRTNLPCPIGNGLMIYEPEISVCRYAWNQGQDCCKCYPRSIHICERYAKIVANNKMCKGTRRSILPLLLCWDSKKVEICVCHLIYTFMICSKVLSTLGLEAWSLNV